MFRKFHRATPYGKDQIISAKDIQTVAEDMQNHCTVITLHGGTEYRVREGAEEVMHWLNSCREADKPAPAEEDPTKLGGAVMALEMIADFPEMEYAAESMRAMAAQALKVLGVRA